jgi:hypothetical protein
VEKRLTDFVRQAEKASPRLQKELSPFLRSAFPKMSEAFWLPTPG